MTHAAALPAGYRRIAFDRVASTNDELRRFAEAGAAQGLLVTGGMQTRGRGRHGRTWISPHGNLYVSFLLRPSVRAARAGQLGFGIAAAVAETVELIAPGHKVECKWPNDVLVDGGKIGGILLESRGTPEALDWLIVGIGINVAEAPEVPAWPATSIAALGAEPSVELVLEIMAHRFEHWHRRWRTDGFAPLRQAWLSRAYGLGENIRIGRDGHRREGKFVGLDDSGALLLERSDGRREAISFGEVLG